MLGKPGELRSPGSPGQPGHGALHMEPAKEKKIRARPLEQKQPQAEDLKPEFRLKVRHNLRASMETH